MSIFIWGSWLFVFWEPRGALITVYEREIWALQGSRRLGGAGKGVSGPGPAPRSQRAKGVRSGLSRRPRPQGCLGGQLQSPERDRGEEGAALGVAPAGHWLLSPPGCPGLAGPTTATLEKIIVTIIKKKKTPNTTVKYMNKEWEASRDPFCPQPEPPRPLARPPACRGGGHRGGPGRAGRPPGSLCLCGALIKLF